MKKYTVKEGDTGVLELTDREGNLEIYQPDCDLDKAQEMLYKFYELKTTEGIKVKDAFQIDGVDWFPNSVSMLYWQYFFQVVKYRTVIDKYLAGQVTFSKISPGRFGNLIALLNVEQGERNKTKKLLRNLYHWLITVRNRIIVRKSGDLLLFRYGIDDFRTSEVLMKLEKRFCVLQVTWVQAMKLPKYFLDRNVYFSSSANGRRENFVSLSDDSDVIFKSALDYAQSLINTQIATLKSHKSVFKRLSYRLFVGIDDANVVYPLLYAAQEVVMKTLGFQHGASYLRRHEAYIMRGIERYCWYDNVLLWGEYWKKNILKHNKIFHDSFYILASNKHSYDYSFLPKQGHNKTILVPYEFIADSIKVGEYIKTFIDKGYTVCFKPRPDRSLAAQLHAYYLGKYESGIHIVENITPEIMAEMDVVAGTQTSLLFDLLPYNKPVWILDTPFRLIYDMVEDGLARLITEQDMPKIDEIFEEEVGKKRFVNFAYISGDKPIVDVIEEYIR